MFARSLPYRLISDISIFSLPIRFLRNAARKTTLVVETSKRYVILL